MGAGAADFLVTCCQSSLAGWPLAAVAAYVVFAVVAAIAGCCGVKTVLAGMVVAEVGLCNSRTFVPKLLETVSKEDT